MGIHFACHVCSKHLNIKQELAGKRGVCPACSAKFRIPRENCRSSSPIEANVPPEQTPTQKMEPPSDTSTPLASGAVDGQLHQIDNLIDDPEATWYVRPPSGGQYGPADSTLLHQWIEEGRVASSALLWRDGWPQWRTASETLPGLVSRLPGKSGSSPTTSGGNPSTNPPTESSDPTKPAQPAAKNHAFRAPTEKPHSVPAEEESSSVDLAGNQAIGTQRRRRTQRRIFMIGSLSAIAIALIGTLFLLMNR